jgi:hypothetical protein
LESSGRKGMESMEDSMDPKVKEKHEDSKKERKSRTTSLNPLEAINQKKWKL